MKVFLIFWLFLVLCSTVFAQTTWHVRAGADPATADGSSWATAIPDLHDALAVAQAGDAIWIAEGVYKPSNTADRYATFTLRDGIRLYGGFAGTETDISQRAWAEHPSILSGDIGVPGDSTDNSFGILYAKQTNLNTRVDGLIFEYGNAGNPDNVNVFSHQRTHSGSAIYLDGQGAGHFARLTIAHCTFRHNRSDHFGAVYANGRDNGQSALIMENCTFEYNTAYNRGGALVVENYTPQTTGLAILQSTFRENFAYLGGGAIYTEHHQHQAIVDCTFDKNAIFGGAGGALSAFLNAPNINLNIDYCRFTGNKGQTNIIGGAVDCFVQQFKAFVYFQNCFFAGQQADNGGCISVTNQGSCDLFFEQCRFQGNFAANGSLLGTVDANGNLNAQLDHCLMYKNQYPEFTLGAFQLDTVRLNNCLWIRGDPSAGSASYSTLLLNHCLVNAPDCASLGPNAVCGPGMQFGADPMFANIAAGDFRLRPCSPGINAGDNAATLATGISFDLNSQPRILDETVDIGPYEHNLFFANTTIRPESCTGARDGAIDFNGYFCPPLSVSWTKDGTSGARTDSLPAGTYVFTLNDGRGHASVDTVLVPGLPPIVIVPDVVPVSCFGMSDGIASMAASGGTPPYLATWQNSSHAGALFNLPAGMYPVTLTDDKGCTASATIAVPDPGLMQVFYTMTPVSGAGQSDGQIQIDSIAGGTGPYSWQPATLTDLSAGTYLLTLTDANNCIQVVPVIVGLATGTATPDDSSLVARLSPNPAATGQKARLAVDTGTIDAVWVQDATGRIIRKIDGHNPAIDLIAPEKPGVYWLTVQFKNRGFTVRWVVW